MLGSKLVLLATRLAKLLLFTSEILHEYSNYNYCRDVVLNLHSSVETKAFTEFTFLQLTHATELVLYRAGFSETFDLLDFSKWSRR